MGIFSKKSDTPSPSISPAAYLKQQREKDKAEMQKRLADGIRLATEDKYLYLNKSKQLLNRIRQSNDRTQRAVAMKQLKLTVGMYRYCCASQAALETVKGRMDMIAMTDDVAKVIHTVNGLKLPQNSVDFNRLLGEAMKSFPEMNLEGMDQLTDTLIGTSVKTDDVEDDYLAALINGTEVLGDDVPVKMPEIVENIQQPVQLPKDAVNIVDASNGEKLLDALDELEQRLNGG